MECSKTLQEFLSHYKTYLQNNDLEGFYQAAEQEGDSELIGMSTRFFESKGIPTAKFIKTIPMSYCFECDSNQYPKDFYISGSQRLVIPKKFLSIPQMAFAFCDFKELDLGEVQDISGYAFSNNDFLKRIIIRTLESPSIDHTAFEDCPNLKVVAIPRAMSSQDEVYIRRILRRVHELTFERY